MDTGQYMPVSTLETQTDDPLSVRIQRDLLRACNNAKVYACRQPSRKQVFFPAMESEDNTTKEHVLAVMQVPIIPNGYPYLLVSVSTIRSSGSDSVTWQFYHQHGLYKGGKSSHDRSWLTSPNAGGVIITNKDYWTSKHTVPIIEEGISNDQSVLIITATNGDLTTRAKITTIDVIPVSIY